MGDHIGGWDPFGECNQIAGGIILCVGSFWWVGSFSGWDHFGRWDLFLWDNFVGWHNLQYLSKLLLVGDIILIGEIVLVGIYRFGKYVDGNVSCVRVSPLMVESFDFWNYVGRII